MPPSVHPARPVPRTTRLELTPELFDLREPVHAAIGDSPAHHVRAALDTRLRALLRYDPGTRSGEDIEDLHQMRVAVRRMRAALRAARPLLDATWANGLRAELGWLGRALGPVRDLDVLLARLRAETADLPAAERAASERLIGDLEAQRAAARPTMLQALASTRYAALLERLADAVRLPLPTPSATEQQPELLELVRAEYGKLRDAVEAAGPDPPNDLLHALRIRGKRLRYTAELVEPALGTTAPAKPDPSTTAPREPDPSTTAPREPDPSTTAPREPAAGPPAARRIRRLLKATAAFQDLLGEHQDACVAEHRIHELLDGLVDLPDVPVAFVAGRLVERERVRAAEARSRWWAAWQRVSVRAAAL